MEGVLELDKESVDEGLLEPDEESVDEGTPEPDEIGTSKKETGKPVSVTVTKEVPPTSAAAT